MLFTELKTCKLSRIFRNNEIFLDVSSVLKHWGQTWLYLIIHSQWIISLPLLTEHLCTVNKDRQKGKAKGNVCSFKYQLKNAKMLSFPWKYETNVQRCPISVKGKIQVLYNTLIATW